MNNFLQNVGVIRSSPTRQKAALVREDRSETLNQNFSNDFEDNVTQTDGPEVFVCIRRIHLRNKSNERV